MKPTGLTESEYQAHMERIEALMLKGSERLTESELIELRTLIAGAGLRAAALCT